MTLIPSQRALFRTLHTTLNTTIVATRACSSHTKQFVIQNLQTTTSQLCRHFTTTLPTMSPPVKEEKDAAHSKGHASEDIDGQENEWKFRAPYKIHEDKDDFDVKLEAHCHCGRVHYQLKRDRPLDAKYCHCTTCQRLHGMFSSLKLLMRRGRTELILG